MLGVEGSERLQGVDQLLFNSPKVTSSEETKESARDEPVESESGLVEVMWILSNHIYYKKYPGVKFEGAGVYSAGLGGES